MRFPLLTLLAIALPTAAAAHDGAGWIADGDYRTANNTTCCTEKDCGIIYPLAVVWETETVRVTFERDGVLVELRVPKAAVKPNPHDADVWLCALPGEIARGEGRCLFLPLTARLP